MSIPTDAEKTFDKSQHPLMIKILRGIYCNMIKAIGYNKPIANTILNIGKLKTL
jgi:hypothetical protein